MNIFYKRPLSLILCVLLGGFVFSSFGSTACKITVFALGAVLAAIAILRRALGYDKIRLFSLLSVSMIISVLLSTLVFNCFYTPPLCDNAKVVGYISDIEENSDYTAKVTVTTLKINDNEKNSGIVLRLNAEDSKYARKGAVISFTGDIKKIESTADFDARSYYYSRNVFAEIKEYDDFSVIDQREKSSYDHAADLNERVSRYSVLTLGEKAGGLFAAVCLGNRSHLNPSLNLDFKRIGISHILALSGMHLAILAHGLTLFLSFLRIGKKPRTAIIIVFTVLYMLFTGFSVSVVRAGLMVIISSLLFLLASAKDSLTNLSVSVTVIVLADPAAIFDFSLWLSALATLGIIALSELWSPVTYRKPVWFRLLSFIAVSMASSFFAISATISVTAAFSNTFSLLSSISTLVFSVLIELFIYLGILALVLGAFIPIGSLIMRPLTDLIYKLCSLMSRPSFVLVSSEAIYTRIAIVLLTVSFFAFLALKIRRKGLWLAIITALFISVHALGAVDTLGKLGKNEILVSSGERHDMIIMKSDYDTLVVDAADYSEYNAFDAVKILNDCKIFSVDAYTVTHYSYGLSGYLGELLRYVKVGTILLPEPNGENELAIYKTALTKLLPYGSAIKTYSDSSRIKLGEYSVSPSYRTIYGNGAIKNALTVEYGDTTLTYLGSGMLGYGTSELAKDLISESNVVIFGSHGKKYSPSYTFFLVYYRLDVLINASEGLDISELAKEKYKENGTDIITDTDTVISIKR